jgi:hypothetical protein
LGALVTTGQEDNQLSPALFVIHPVTGTVIDSQFRNTLANGFDIARMSKGKMLDPCLDTRPRLKIAQAIEPASEDIRFADFNYRYSVA